MFKHICKLCKYQQEDKCSYPFPVSKSFYASERGKARTKRKVESCSHFTG